MLLLAMEEGMIIFIVATEKKIYYPRKKNTSVASDQIEPVNTGPQKKKKFPKIEADSRR